MAFEAERRPHSPVVVEPLVRRALSRMSALWTGFSACRRAQREALEATALYERHSRRCDGDADARCDPRAQAAQEVRGRFYGER